LEIIGGDEGRKAPTAMIPSHPRLNTPALWLNISPKAARRRATEKGMPRERMLRTRSMRFIAPPGHEAVKLVPGIRIVDEHLG
jgi:hypothetical protein